MEGTSGVSKKLFPPAQGPATQRICTTVKDPVSYIIAHNGEKPGDVHAFRSVV